MAITLKEVVVLSFEILNPVGRGAFNRADDMTTIKALLNGISSPEGGAANTLNEKDVSISGPEFNRFVEAIEIFQARHFRGLFRPDGVVSPEKKTHKKLRELFLNGRSKRNNLIPLPVFIGPLGALNGLSNETGFSAERLVKAADGEWTTRNGLLDPIQVIPVGETRRFRVTPRPGVSIDSLNLSTQILEPGTAQLVGNDDKIITVVGKLPGFATLRVSASGISSDVKIMVRSRRGINLHLTVLGNILPPGGEIALRDSIVSQLNRIFQPQTNQIFLQGSAKVVTKIRSVARNVTFDINTAQKISLDSTNSVAPSVATPQLVHTNDLLAIDPGASEQLRLFIGNINFISNPSVVGEAFAGIGKKAAWFRLDQIGRKAENSFSTIAHETGHAMGLFHIHAVPNTRFLMFPFVSPQDNSLIIPAETSIDLGPP